MEEEPWAGLDLSDLGGCCKFIGKNKRSLGSEQIVINRKMLRFDLKFVLKRHGYWGSVVEADRSVISIRIREVWPPSNIFNPPLTFEVKMEDPG